MKKAILIVFITTIYGGLCGQKQKGQFTRIYLKPSVGMDLPLTTFWRDKHITDNLVEYGDSRYYIQMEMDYFFTKNWGIELTFNRYRLQRKMDAESQFFMGMEERYNDDYYVTSSTEMGLYLKEDAVQSMERGHLGIVYRKENQKHLYLAKLRVGGTSFIANWGKTGLKKKGEHEFIMVSYEPNSRVNDMLTISPAFTYGYRITKNILVNVDVAYSYCNSNLRYEERIRNVFTDEESVRMIDYNKHLHSFSIGAGLIFDMNRKLLKKMGLIAFPSPDEEL